SLRLRALTLEKLDDRPIKILDVTLAAQKIPARFTLDEKQLKIAFDLDQRIAAGSELSVVIQS
ncbi:MAG: hypothetical protein ACHQD7_14500, partial [Chitinophagales bacterium]